MIGNLINWFAGLFSGTARAKAQYEASGRPQKIREKFSQLRAKFDNAESNRDNHDLYRNADCLSAVDANSLDVRKTLRERARNEVSNGSHARGITLTLANDLIGTGPRLQILLEDEGVCNAVEKAWSEWAEEINFAEKLHTFTLASIVDGEAFALMTTNPMLNNSVQLDVRNLECDRITEPSYYGATTIDGIQFDRYGNPFSYKVLKQHPGSTGYGYGYSYFQDADTFPARSIVHYFRTDRSEQVRGIPEITPALHIFGQLRRYTLAVLEAAELAADFAVFMHTTADPDPDPEDPEPRIKAFAASSIEKGMLTPLPVGYQPFQLKAEQPTTGFDQFTKTLLREAAHCLLIPYNVATADFSEDSYAGGRMALQVYQRSMKVRRKHLMTRVLNRIFAEWLNEAVRIPKLLPSIVRESGIPHTWFFDGWGHVDPTKESRAVTERLNNFTTTLAIECAENGLDWQQVVNQRAREINKQKSLGVLILMPGTPPLDQSDGQDDQQQPQEPTPAKEAA